MDLSFESNLQQFPHFIQLNLSIISIKLWNLYYLAIISSISGGYDLSQSCDDKLLFVCLLVHKYI